MVKRWSMFVVAVAASGWSGCASRAPEVSADRIQAEEDRLLLPFARDRDVIADVVEVIVSPNFVGSRVDVDRLRPNSTPKVALPGIDRNLHEHRQVRGNDGVTDVYTNQRGGIERPLCVTIGSTRYRALRSLTIRVLPSGARMTLDAVASGEVAVLEGDSRVDLPAMEIRDGIWRGR